MSDNGDDACDQIVRMSNIAAMCDRADREAATATVMGADAPPVNLFAHLHDPKSDPRTAHQFGTTAPPAPQRVMGSSSQPQPYTLAVKRGSHLAMLHDGASGAPVSQSAMFVQQVMSKVKELYDRQTTMIDKIAMLEDSIKYVEKGSTRTGEAIRELEALRTRVKTECETCIIEINALVRDMTSTGPVLEREWTPAGGIMFAATPGGERDRILLEVDERQVRNGAVEASMQSILTSMGLATNQVSVNMSMLKPLIDVPVFRPDMPMLEWSSHIRTVVNAVNMALGDMSNPSGLSGIMKIVQDSKIACLLTTELREGAESMGLDWDAVLKRMEMMVPSFITDEMVEMGVHVLGLARIDIVMRIETGIALSMGEYAPHVVSSVMNLMEMFSMLMNETNEGTKRRVREAIEIAYESAAIGRLIVGLNVGWLHVLDDVSPDIVVDPGIVSPGYRRLAFDRDFALAMVLEGLDEVAVTPKVVEVFGLKISGKAVESLFCMANEDIKSEAARKFLTEVNKVVISNGDRIENMLNILLVYSTSACNKLIRLLRTINEIRTALGNDENEIAALSATCAVKAIMEGSIAHSVKSMITTVCGKSVMDESGSMLMLKGHMVESDS